MFRPKGPLAHDAVPREAKEGGPGPLRYFECCCGGGSSTLGMIMAGMHVVGACDLWAEAVAVHNANLGSGATVFDLSRVHEAVTMIRALQPDVIGAGTPCQDFSAAGQRIEGERAGMTVAIAIIAASSGAEWVVLENVPRAAKAAAWQLAVRILREAGFGVTQMVINCAFYGVPQRRKRLVLVGRRGERDGFMESAIRNAASPREMSVEDLFGDTLRARHVYSHARHPDRRAVWSVKGPYSAVRNNRRPEPAGRIPHRRDSNFPAGFYMQPRHGGKATHPVTGPASTVTRTSRENPRRENVDNPHPGNFVPVEAAHVFTQKQLQMIQGFPEDYDFSAAGTLRAADQMIANAFPAPVARMIGVQIIRRHRGETVPEVVGRFGAWLAARGMNAQMVANVRWRLKRGTMMVGGRTFASLPLHLEALEAAPRFRAMSGHLKSAFRRAACLHKEWLDEPETPRIRRRARRPRDGG